MADYPIGVTKSLQTWDFQRNTVERPTDNASYEAAHPDDTLLLAGPARRGIARPGRTGPYTLMAIGLFQGFTMQAQVPVAPLMAIGSGRSFFLRGKSQAAWTIQRVLMNGRNLLRVLYHNAIEVGLQPNQLDDPAALEDAPRSQFFINLDSELYYIPFGIACTIRAKAHALVASFYMELCMINSYGIGVQAGQNLIAESVSGLCDRALPYQAADLASNPRVAKATIDAVLGLANNVFPNSTPDRMAQFDDSGLDTSVVAAR